MIRSPWCPDCERPVCCCYQKRRGLVVEVAKEAEAIPAPETEEILLGSVAPLAADGLFIEGVATTRGWNHREAPLAAGLKSLDGRTTWTTRGTDPASCVLKLPLPILWRHDWAKPLGEVFELRARGDAVLFRGCITPLDTPGYTRSLLADAWEGVRSGTVSAVSFHHDTDAKGQWRGRELSVCEKPGNPFAVITRAAFADGSLVERPMPQFTPADAWWAFRKFMEGHEGRRAKVEKAAPAEVMTWAGTWREGNSYEAGATCNHGSALWVCLSPTMDTPGTSDNWQLAVKRPVRHGRPGGSLQ